VAQDTFDVADRTQRLLAKASLKGQPVPDLIIAAQAELVGLTVPHYDANFDLIASVTRQPTLWISPPGSID
jgi:predicted nucleic acid-binding protein